MRRHGAGSTAIAKISSRAGRAEVRTEIANLDTRLIWWMVGTVIANATLAVGILRLIGIEANSPDQVAQTCYCPRRGPADRETEASAADPGQDRRHPARRQRHSGGGRQRFRDRESDTDAIVRAVDYQVVGSPEQFRVYSDDVDDVARWARV